MRAAVIEVGASAVYRVPPVQVQVLQEQKEKLAGNEKPKDIYSFTQCAKPTGYEPAQGGTKAGAKLCGTSHDKHAILTGTAGTKPALCAGKTKRQFVIFPR